jgi:hypothetical protein
MKKRIVLAAILLATLFGFKANTTNAQVSFNLNLDTQPLWGPTGYDYVQYYYIPDADAYYDVANQTYVYNSGGQWVTSSSLPYNVDLYRVHKVVINEPSPWLHHDRYRSQYGRFRGRHDQVVIRDSRDQRYWANPNHPYHSRWQGYGREQRHEWGGYRRNDWRDNRRNWNDNRRDWRDNRRDDDHDRGHGHDRDHH